MPVHIDQIDTSVREAPREGRQSPPITREMIRQIADRVYAIWLNDLRIEAERKRLASRGMKGER